MIMARLVGNGLERLREFKERLERAGKVSCRLYPTIVLEELSRMKGRSVLSLMPSADEAEVRRQASPKIKNALVKNEGNPSAQDVAVGKGYRYWVYRLVEVLWRSVNTKRAWGIVRSSTRRVKQLPPRKGGVGRNIDPEAFGVRHRAPAWYSIQKGQKKVGKRRPDRPETRADIFEITLGGRKLVRGSPPGEGGA